MNLNQIRRDAFVNELEKIALEGAAKPKGEFPVVPVAIGAGAAVAAGGLGALGVMHGKELTDQEAGYPREVPKHRAQAEEVAREYGRIIKREVGVKPPKSTLKEARKHWQEHFKNNPTSNKDFAKGMSKIRKTKFTAASLRRVSAFMKYMK